MAVPPKLAGLIKGNLAAPNTLELYIDYLCPFSKKLLVNVDEGLWPLIQQSKDFKDQVKIVVRPTPQPWHVSSPLLHEAALAVANVAPGKFWEFSVLLIKSQDRWYDERAKDLTPNTIRDELAAFAGKYVPDKAAVRRLLEPAEGNSGGQVVPDLKYVIKVGRQNGIHVTPTVLFNGVIEGSISSSWEAEQWREFLDGKIPKGGL